jgi:hypothetical protein
MDTLSLIFAPIFLHLPNQDADLINTHVHDETAFVQHLLRHLPGDLLDSELMPLFKAPGPASQQVGVQMGTTLLGIGGNGAGLAPRSRKTSTVRS